MSISLITTVLNEERTIEEFINSIFSQNQLPDEIIIVDGGSIDKTVEKIRNYELKFKKKKIRFKLFKKYGNRSVGRNEAIKQSKDEIILSTDAGCTLDKNWIRNIIEPFKNPKVDVVAGYYKGKPKSVFEKCLVPYVLVMPDRVNPNNFLPSTRSMAFRKQIWKKVGGFSEAYSHNEDYVFAWKLKKNNARIVFEKDAIVYWIPRKNIKEAFVMFFRFAFGDSEANVFRPKALLIFIRYIILMLLLIFTVVNKDMFIAMFIFISITSYIIWSIWKNYKYVNDVKSIYFLPLIQITSDIAVLTGTFLGTSKKYLKQ